MTSKEHQLWVEEQSHTVGDEQGDVRRKSEVGKNLVCKGVVGVPFLSVIRHS